MEGSNKGWLVDLQKRYEISGPDWELVASTDGDGEPAWGQALPARVPGAILEDLRCAGLIPDPFHGENFREVAWVGESTFWFRKRVDLAGWVAGEQTILQFDGIDTYGEIFWNGESLGTVDNQFMRHRFVIPSAKIQQGVNELVVRIDPVKKAFHEWYERVRPDSSGVWALFDTDRPWIRKAQMTFGWDNCPYLVAGGITLPVWIEKYPPVRIEDVQWKVTAMDAGSHWCRLALCGVLTGSEADRRIHLCGRCGTSFWEVDTKTTAGGHWQVEVEISDARLWWPNGQGSPDLYDVAIQALDLEGAVLAREHLRIGLRQVRVITEPAGQITVDYRIGRKDAAANDGLQMDGACIGPWRRVPLAEPEMVELRPFYFEVNGRRIFVKGFDWQAPDVLLGRVDDGQIQNMIEAVVASGSNMLRAWGGGAVERESFYRLCDEHGLLLWQDFFFACAIYPRDPAFLRRIEAEVTDVICRLRNHTCLVAWCGDNESDMIEFDAGRDPSANVINKELLPSALARLDWQGRYYHCSSPSGGPYPRSDFGGDKRNWGPNFPHDNYRHIRQESARFISESGMKSFPSREAIAQAIPEERRWPLDNSTWRLHWGDLDNTVRGDYLLDDDCVRFFGEASTLEERIRLSQFAQAYGTRLLIDQCRRRKEECGGILIWKTSDQWPGCDQGVFDSTGRLRPVYDSIQAAFQPVVVSISQGFGQSEDQVEWWVVSDLDSPVRGTFTARAVSLSTGQTSLLSTHQIDLPADASQMVLSLPVKSFDPEREILLGSLEDCEGKPHLSPSTWYALLPRTAFLYHQHQSP